MKRLLGFFVLILWILCMPGLSLAAIEFQQLQASNNFKVTWTWTANGSGTVTETTSADLIAKMMGKYIIQATVYVLSGRSGYREREGRGR